MTWEVPNIQTVAKSRSTKYCALVCDSCFMCIYPGCIIFWWTSPSKSIEVAVRQLILDSQLLSFFAPIIFRRYATFRFSIFCICKPLMGSAWPSSILMTRNEAIIFGAVDLSDCQTRSLRCWVGGYDKHILRGATHARPANLGSILFSVLKKLRRPRNEKGPNQRGNNQKR